MPASFFNVSRTGQTKIQPRPVYNAYLLSEIGGTTNFAYSLRQLTSSYTGPVALIKRLSDDATMTVDFNLTGVVDWIGSSTASMVYWYDQSGNRRHLTGSSGNEPLLHPTGSTFTNNKPYFEVSSTRYATNANFDPDGQTDGIWNAVASPIGSQNAGGNLVNQCVIFINENSGWGTCALGVFDTSIAWRFGTGQGGNTNSKTITTSNQLKSVVVSKRTSVEKAFLNGVQQGTDNTGKFSTISGNTSLLEVGGGDASGGAPHPNTRICELIGTKNLGASDEATMSFSQTSYYSIP